MSLFINWHCSVRSIYIKRGLFERSGCTHILGEIRRRQVERWLYARNLSRLSDFELACSLYGMVLCRNISQLLRNGFGRRWEIKNRKLHCKNLLNTDFIVTGSQAPTRVSYFRFVVRKRFIFSFICIEDLSYEQCLSVVIKLEVSEFILFV